MNGSTTISADVGGAIRGWLVLTTDAARGPVVLDLVDEPYGTDRTRNEANLAVNEQARKLWQKLLTLSEDQTIALLQQGGHFSGVELVERILRYADRPRLDAIDWLRTPTSAATVTVPKWTQDHDWDLPAGTKVMLGGDGFEDLHGEVVEEHEGSWVVQIFWETDRLTGNHRPPRHVAAGIEPDAVDRNSTVDVTAVRVVEEHLLHLTFATGESGYVDLGPKLWGPMFEPLREDYDSFCRVTVDPEAGTIVWPNGADYDPRVLHREATQLADLASLAQLETERDAALAARDRASAERDEARFYARGFVSGMWLAEGTPYDVDNPPEWIYDRVDEHGFPVTWDGERCEGPPRPSLG